MELDLLEAGLRLAIPLLLAALGELVVERSGVINIGIEGMMLAGAFFAFWGSAASGSAAIGLCCGVGAAAALGVVFIGMSVILPCDQIVTGAAVNLFALGLTGLCFRSFFGSNAAAAAAPQAPIVPLEAGLLALILFLYFFFKRSVPGLVVRAAGESPLAVKTMGHSVRRVRAAAVLFGGAMAGLAGAYLSIVHSASFTEGMTAGRGFIALAIVIFGRWHPLGVGAAAVFFGGALALQYHWQALGSWIPYQWVRMFPYLLTLGVLALLGQKKGGAPAALGEPFRN